MSKFVLLLALICLVFLMIGSLLIPNNAVMWLAGTSLGYNVIRGITVAVLLALLVTHPPRNMVLRLVFGVTATALVTGSLMLTYQDNLRMLDTLSLSAAGTAIGIAALEIGYEVQPVDLEALRRAKHNSYIARAK